MVHDYSKIRELNPTLMNKIIYWTFDTDKDKYSMKTYENIKLYNSQENIRYMLALIYDKITKILYKKLVALLNKHNDLPMKTIETMLYLYSELNNLSGMSQLEEKSLIDNEYLRKINLQNPSSSLLQISPEDKSNMPEYIFMKEMIVYKISIDMINPLHLQLYKKIEAYKEKPIDETHVVGEVFREKTIVNTK